MHFDFSNLGFYILGNSEADERMVVLGTCISVYDYGVLREITYTCLTGLAFCSVERVKDLKCCCFAVSFFETLN